MGKIYAGLLIVENWRAYKQAKSSGVMVGTALSDIQTLIVLAVRMVDT